MNVSFFGLSIVRSYILLFAYETIVHTISFVWSAYVRNTSIQVNGSMILQQSSSWPFNLHTALYVALISFCCSVIVINFQIEMIWFSIGALKKKKNDFHWDTTLSDLYWGLLTLSDFFFSLSIHSFIHSFHGNAFIA